MGKDDTEMEADSKDVNCPLIMAQIIFYIIGSF